LRPVFHYTEKRVRRHVAICVLATVFKAEMSIDLRARKLTDPDLEGQQLTARRALRELERVRMVRFSDAEGNERQVVTRPTPSRPRSSTLSVPTPPPGAHASPITHDRTLSAKNRLTATSRTSLAKFSH